MTLAGEDTLNIKLIDGVHLFEGELGCKTRFFHRLGVPIGSVHLDHYNDDDENDDADGNDDDNDDDN